MISLDLTKEEVTLLWKLLVNTADVMRDDARRLHKPEARSEASEAADACITMANKNAKREAEVS